MALNKATLENELKSVFAAMRDGSKTDAWMAEQMSLTIKNYILSGQVQTADAGAAPAGSYTGSGTGKMTIKSDDLKNDLKSTFENTKTNAFLAAGISANIGAVCTANDTIATDTSGTVSTPAGAVSPMTGKGKGKFSGVSAAIQTLLSVCFETMNTMKSGGDDYLAAQIANAVDTYLKSGVVSVTLQAPLTGSGAGSLL